jgi:hypothetical protein
VSGQIPGSKASQVYKNKAITWTPGTMVCNLILLYDLRVGGDMKGRGKSEAGMG